MCFSLDRQRNMFCYIFLLHFLIIQADPSTFRYYRFQIWMLKVQSHIWCKNFPFLSSSHPPITLRPAREKGMEEAGLFFHSFLNFTSAFLLLWCFWVFLSFLVNISSPDSRHANWSLLRTVNSLILVHWHEAKLFSNSVSIKARDWEAHLPFLQKTFVFASASLGMSLSHHSLGNIYPLIFFLRLIRAGQDDNQLPSPGNPWRKRSDSFWAVFFRMQWWWWSC